MTGEIANRSTAAVASISEDAGFYTSLQLTTRADKMAMLRAVNNSTPLLDIVGKEVAIVDVILQVVDIADEDGTVTDAVRATLIDNEGNAFHATSKGVVQALKNTFKVLGEPGTWEEPLNVTVREEKGRKGFRYLTLDI